MIIIEPPLYIQTQTYQVANDKTFAPAAEVKKPLPPGVSPEARQDARQESPGGEKPNKFNLLDITGTASDKVSKDAGDNVLTAAGRDAVRDGRLSREALDKLISRAQETHSDSIAVIKDGKLVAQWYSDNEKKMLLTHSMTKSVTNLAVGQLVDQGKLNLDEKVSDFFPQWKEGAKKDVTVRELMNHTSGMPYHAKEPTLRAALDAELQSQPGTKFEYSTAAVDVLAGIVEKISGKPIDQYVDKNIFQPLGIKDYKWPHDPDGHAEGGTGLFANATDLAKIGQLALNGGKWEGKQIVSAEWIAKSTTPSQTLNKECGLLWWIDQPHYNKDQSEHGRFVGSEGFSAKGMNGQFISIVPKENLVAVRQIDSKKYKGGDDEFTDFTERVRDLVPMTMAPMSLLHR